MKNILLSTNAISAVLDPYAAKASDQSLPEEKADTALLIIDKDGTLTGVTDKTELNGKLALPAEVKKIDDEAFAGCNGLTEVLQ